MNTATMRAALAEVYPRRTWKARVKQMSEDQVVAVYKSMEREGRLFKHEKEQSRVSAYFYPQHKQLL